MRRFPSLLMIVSLIFVAPAAAYQSSPVWKAASHRAWLPEMQYAVPPLAFAIFCRTYAEECRSDERKAVVSLDAELWSDLEEVNALVNRRIKPDAASMGLKAWSLETTFGDCNDYAVQKRHELLRRGWPMSALSLAVVTTPSGVGHLVLTVRTTDGDFVLDNLRPSLVTWDQTNYRFLRRQALAQPRYWIDLSTASRHERSVMPDAEIAYNWKIQPSIALAQSMLSVKETGE